MKANLLKKIGITVLLTLVMLLLLVYSVIGVVMLGPSEYASRLLVTTLMETSAAKFVPRLYMSAEAVDAIIGKEEEATDLTVEKALIKLPEKTQLTPDDPGTVPADTDTDTDGIEIFDVKGATFYGKMMVIDDPTRVFVGIPKDGFGEGKSGMTVHAMIEHYDAIAGTNAGGFYDPNGNGTGGIPDGIVIYEGKLLWGNLGSYYSLAGIDGDGLLHVGRMTAQTAMDRGIQYAASYGPALIVNGTPQNEKRALGGGLNPRTAIGQREDGAILLLVVNGRSVDSLGATLDDLVEVFLEYGAVNATNLDGGSSSLMIYEGENVTHSAYVYGERVVATSILVKK
ncbi:MAG: phosphodiester glycosidase family protein [Clostridia bacterium]|nr:phosphodiester glycosidase family protein [Clostridia bacterium]